ncbi:MAG: hypothetical protein WBM78_27320, partial [Desulfobacterales bacterium]
QDSDDYKRRDHLDQGKTGAMPLHNPTPEKVREIRNGFSKNFSLGLINSEKPSLFILCIGS